MSQRISSLRETTWVDIRFKSMWRGAILVLLFLYTIDSVAQQEEVSKHPSLTVDEGSWVLGQWDLWKFQNNTLSQLKPGENIYKVRRPRGLAYYKGSSKYQDFVLEADIRCTDGVDVAGRDVILVFGYVSDSQFYYVHLSNDNKIMPHNGIFKVDKADRERIDEQWPLNPPETRLHDQKWQHTKILRNSETGKISVFLDDMTEPLMTATDKTFQSGYVGFGSFDNFGEIKNLKVSETEQKWLEIDDFDDFQNGNILNQHGWVAGPPGATDGGRISSMGPGDMSGKVFENNTSGVQFRGNAYREVGSVAALNSTFTFYFEMNAGSASDVDFSIGLSSEDSIDITSYDDVVSQGLGIRIVDSKIISLLRNGNREYCNIDPNKTYQIWLSYDGNSQISKLYIKEKNQEKTSVIERDLLHEAYSSPLRTLFILNNASKVPTGNSYVDRIYISNGSNLSVPPELAMASKVSNIVPIKNPIKEPIKMGDISVKLEEVVTMPVTDTASNTKARINYLTHSGDGTGRLFVNDLRGQLYSVEDGEASLFLDIREHFPNFVDAPRQNSGLGFMAFHPNFKNNGIFYTSHTEAKDALATKPDYDTPLKTKVHHVVTEWKQDSPSHNEFTGTKREVIRVGMSTLLHGIQGVYFNPTVSVQDTDYGMLYIAMGDGEENPNQSSRPQMKSGHEAKIFRIDPRKSIRGDKEYRIPADNPFTEEEGSLKEIWAMGIRNPHRISWDRKTSKMHIGMIGENQIDAIYEGRKGANYGWNVREGSFVFDRSNPSYVTALPENDTIYNFTYPVAQFDHDDMRAIVSGGVYRGDMIPELEGKFICGGIVFGKIFYIDEQDMSDGGGNPVIKELQLRNTEGEKISFRDEVITNKNYSRVDLKFGSDEAGEIYLLSKTNGKVYKLVRN